MAGWMRRYRGLSLIEILIAMAVFLIGILAILRIFPSGIGTITQASERQEAVRLAEARMNELLVDSDRLPDYILPAGRPTDTATTSGSDPNPGFGFLRNLTNSYRARPYDYAQKFGSDATVFNRVLADDRLVVGERVLVGRRVTSDTLTPAARPYHTLFGPIEQIAGAPDVAIFREFRRVVPLELRRTVVGGFYRDRAVFSVIDGGRDPFTGSELADRLLFELDAAQRVFAVRFAYLDAYGNVKWLQMLPVIVGGTSAAGAAYNEVALTDRQATPAPVTNVIPESVQVRQVLSSGTVDNDLANRFNYGGGASTAGVLYFSPNLAGESLSLEYVVDDWRNLREVMTVKVNASGQIVDDADQPLTRLQLSARNLDEGFLPRVVVKSTGAVITVDATAWSGDPGLARQGLVPIDSGTTLDALAGLQDLYIYYRRFGNWQVAPSIAPSAYLMEADAIELNSNYPVPNLMVETPTGPVVGSNTYREVWFRPSEAGRTVAVTYEVGATRRLVCGELHVIPTQANRTTTGGEPRHAILLDEPNVATDTGATPRPLIHAIEGRSLQVRVAYDEDVAGREATATDGTAGITAERLVELGTYARRSR